RNSVTALRRRAWKTHGRLSSGRSGAHPRCHGPGVGGGGTLLTKAFDARTSPPLEPPHGSSHGAVPGGCLIAGESRPTAETAGSLPPRSPPCSRVRPAGG